MERLAVVWEGATVGHMTDARSDMWYLEGGWVPAESPATSRFLRVVARLDAREVMRDRATGVAVELVESDGARIRAVVVAKPRATLCVRMTP
jgi:hypothetical protein